MLVKYIGLPRLYRSFFVAFMDFTVPVLLNNDHYSLFFLMLLWEQHILLQKHKVNMIFFPSSVTLSLIMYFLLISPQMLFLTNSIWTPGNLVPLLSSHLMRVLHRRG